ncbi:hypothetical protein [Deinococcus aluminii]|uniref:Uncharacterized protein n=1 Tax=Deinococcus aluminii TaxID=1656885 RepID=A0ABP9XBI4_9DEIO
MTHSPRPEAAPGRTPDRSPAAPRTPYTPPRVQDLGPWQAVTLSYSVPIGPGGFLNPGRSDSRDV